MKNNRRILVIKLLLTFSLAALCEGAFGAQRVNIPTSPSRSIYLVVRDSASSTRCAIIQMNENDDGTLSKSSEYDGKLRGTPINAFYCRSNGHLYLNLSNGSRSNTLIAQFEFRKDGQIFPATPFALLGVGSASLKADASNGLVLSLELTTGVVSLLSVDVSSGVLHLITKLNLHLFSSFKSTAKDALNDPNIFMGDIVADSFATYFYVSESDFLDPRADSILQLRITSAGKILPLDPPDIKTKFGYLSEYDTVHRVLYSFVRNGDLRAFSVASNGRLRPLMKEPTVRSADNLENRNAAATDDNMIRIYPVPPPPAPPITVVHLALDSRHNVLLGSGGTNENEIYVWRTSSNGPVKLVSRYWYNQFGDLENADPDVGDNKNAMVATALPAIPIVSSDGQYLYLFREFLGAQSEVPQVASVISYKVSSSGDLLKTSSDACRGIDLSKLSLVNPIVRYGAH